MTHKKTDEEKRGPKVIQWTQFTIPPKNLIDYSKIETASQKMTAAKIFPVIKYINIIITKTKYFYCFSNKNYFYLFYL